MDDLNKYRIKLSEYVSQDIEYFVSGHFPQNVMYPGVVILELIDWALKDWLKKSYKRDYTLSEVSEINFQHSIIANQDFYLEFEIRFQEENTVKAYCKVFLNEIEAVKTKLKYLLWE